MVPSEFHKPSTSDAAAKNVVSNVARRLQSLGLRIGVDFFVWPSSTGSHYACLDLASRDLLTKPLLEECSAAHGPNWGVIVSAPESRGGEFKPIVEVSGGGFTYVSGGKAVVELVEATWASVMGRSDL